MKTRKMSRRTLTATENIANAMTNACETESGGTATEDVPPGQTPLPSISSLLQSATNTGISINIHVTNDVNGERAAHASSEDASADRGCNSLEQAPASQGSTLAGEMGRRPVEGQWRIRTTDSCIYLFIY